MDTASKARGLAEILSAMAECPTQPTKDFFATVSELAWQVAAEVEKQPVQIHRAA